MSAINKIKQSLEEKKVSNTVYSVLTNGGTTPPSKQAQVNYQNIANMYNQTITRLQAEIRAERQKQKLTQRQLAAKAGMSQGTITRVECNMWVSLRTLVRVIDALGKQITIT